MVLLSGRSEKKSLEGCPVRVFSPLYEAVWGKILMIDQLKRRAWNKPNKFLTLFQLTEPGGWCPSLYGLLFEELKGRMQLG